MSGRAGERHILEHRIPPPLVALLIAGAMWALARVTPALDLPAQLRVILAAVIALAGIACGIAGTISFRMARTTVNPLKPYAASALVTGGIYRVTRNPMYAGMLLGLLAFAVHLASFAALAGPVAFTLFIQRFQIRPEERVLSEKFGAAYVDYTRRVRRWL